MNFKKITTDIDGVFLIKTLVFEDDRGKFLEMYNKKDFEDIGIFTNFVQDNFSISKRAVLRGLHFQNENFSQTKLLRVIKGSILDVVVDLRKNSNTFGKYLSFHLDDKNGEMLFIPKNFAHGFLSLEENTQILYKCDNYYSKENENSILWCDKDLNINWQLEKYKIDISDLIISEKDRKSKTFKELNL